jgi:hypothetical protein
MRGPGIDEPTEVQILCAELLDDIEILTNLIYLIRDGHSTGVEKEKYLRIAGDKLNELCLIVRKHC